MLDACSKSHTAQKYAFCSTQRAFEVKAIVMMYAHNSKKMGRTFTTSSNCVGGISPHLRSTVAEGITMKIKLPGHGYT